MLVIHVVLASACLALLSLLVLRLELLVTLSQRSNVAHERVRVRVRIPMHVAADAPYRLEVTVLSRGLKPKP